jgi:hypothetical protein
VREKGFALPLVLVVVVVGIVVAGAIAYLQSKPKITQQPQSTPSPTPASTPISSPQDETADWKKFESRAPIWPNFEFKYPNLLKIKLYGPEGAGTVLENVKTNKESIMITYVNKPTPQTLKEFATKAINKPYGLGGKLIEQKSFKVSRQPAYLNKYQPNNKAIIIQVLIEDPKKNIFGYDNIYNMEKFDDSDPSGSNGLTEEKFNQILSTFKFLD